MLARIAINGFGRIGKLVLKAGLNNPNLDFVAINDLTDCETLSYLLEFDSVHGRFPGEIQHGGSYISVNRKEIPVFSEKDPSTLPWKKMDVDITNRRGHALFTHTSFLWKCA